SSNDLDAPVAINLDRIEKMSDGIKKKVRAEFDEVLSLMGFRDMSHDIFRKWYVDGRIYYHKMVDSKNPKKGLQGLRAIDPQKIRKIREVEKKKDEKTSVEVIKNVEEYFLFNDQGFDKSGNNTGQTVRIHPDAVCHVTSGLLDYNKTIIVGYLHKAMKSVNQLRMLEDALVIYRISRAPERRIFYIDVGNLPKARAEQYLKEVQTSYRNKLVYNADTGEIKDDRKHMNMLEDFWLPRREGGRGTEISTLPGGQNLGEIEDILYFQKKLYKSLNVPISRMETETAFAIGRATEISRDEVKFSRFVDRLRTKFSRIFDDVLRTQLLLKNIITDDDWNSYKEYISYDFQKDGHFVELKDAEILRERVSTLEQLDQFVGKYYSEDWIRKNVLRQSEAEIQQIDKEINADGAVGLGPDDDMPDDSEF
ncbi:MAG: portal protein, partial [Gammaproteobacteria bacterium]|nr:portal protein [Gammaproteobacteria bacterium]